MALVSDAGPVPDLGLHIDPRPTDNTGTFSIREQGLFYFC